MRYWVFEEGEKCIFQARTWDEILKFFAETCTVPIGRVKIFEEIPILIGDGRRRNYHNENPGEN